MIPQLSVGPVGARRSWPIVAVAILAVAAAIGATASLAPSAVAWVLLATLVVVVAIVGAQWSRQAGVDAWSPRVAFPLVYTVFFGIGSMNVLSGPPPGYEWAIFLRPVPGAVPLLAGFGLVAYYAGTFVGDRLPHQHSSSERPVGGRVSDRTADTLAKVAGGLAAVAMVSAILALGRSGVPLLSGTDATSRLDLVSANGVANTVYQTLFVCAAGLSTVAAFGAADRRPLRSWIWYAVVVAGVVVGLLLGVRGLIVEMGLIVFPALHFARRRYTSVLIWLGAIGGVLSFIGAFGWWRDSQYLGGSAAFSRAYETLGFPGWSLPFVQVYTYLRGTVVAFSELISAIPTYVPLQHGQVLFAGLGALRPGHQDAADIFVKQLLGLNFSTGLGVPASLLGAFYADFGVAGIGVGMFTVGLVMQWTYTGYRQLGTGGWVLGLAYLTKVTVFSLFAMGPLPYLTGYTVPLVIWISWAFASRSERFSRSSSIPAYVVAAGVASVLAPLIVLWKYFGPLP